ncbi:MAG TPA: MarR family transcriptional regulator [Euzebyales bacterium]|nr:MarR family transcriptional regulator [Euzebyales bacterium]
MAHARPLLSLLFRLLHQHYAQEIDAALREAGFDAIRPAHANVFAFARPEGIHVSELANASQVRKQTMAQAVEQLEALGYVERRPDPRDGRARLVFLTERGRAVRPICVAAGRRVEQRWADLIGDDAVEGMRRTMQDLLRRLETD